MKLDDAKVNRWLKLATIIVLIFLAIYLFADYIMPIISQVLSFVFPLILPFILAIILAVLITPVINWLHKKTKMKRGLVVVVVLVLALAVSVGGLGFLITQLIKEFNVLAADFSDASYGINIPAIIDYFEEFYTNGPLTGVIDPAIIQQGFDKFTVGVTEWLVETFHGFANALRSIPSILFMLLVVGFATYYFCKDENMAVNIITKITPKKIEDTARETYKDMINAFLGYVRATIVLITISGIISVIGFLILRTDYVILMGVLVAICDLLPILGPGTVLVPWAIFNLLTGDLFTGIGLIIIYLVVLVVRQLIQPKLIADGVGLHPLATIVSLYFGLELLGVWGLIFGPILLVVVLGILESLDIRKRRKKIGGKTAADGNSDNS